MKSNFLLKFFPVPEYLAQPALGFDVSDRSLKFMELSKHGQKFNLGRFGERELPVGMIDGGELKEADKFEAILRELKKEFDFKNVFLSLPDDKTYTLNLFLPPMDKSEIKNSIELQLEEYIPLPVSEVVFDYDLVLPIEEGGKLNVGVFVIPQSIVQAYIEVFSRVGLNLLAIETQSEALARALVSPFEPSVVAIVDIGRSHTANFLIENGIVVGATAVAVGGEAITNSLQKNLKIDFNQAESLKMEKGLSRATGDKDIFYSIIPVISAIKDEVERRVGFWLEYRSKQAVENSISLATKLDKIILCGGQSTLPNLAEYLEIHLKQKVVLGNPWLKIFPVGQNVPWLKFNEALRYSTAIGLALRNFTRPD